ncbi:SCO family protein, partial [Mesorhizobium sp. M2A.F.Ca.ET.015.02.1.1]|uniref:SCO family protein n=2 Tax=unclassified Mesorhizobium TaxID=325217 RepID=UPI00167E5883
LMPTTQTGAKLSDADLHGKPFAVFFDFTRCPEVRPTTMGDDRGAEEPVAGRRQLRCCSFRWIQNTRHPGIHGPLSAILRRPYHRMTGTEAQVAAVGKEYRIY